MISKQSLAITLIWVSKFLLFVECQNCNLSIEDPEWKKMWYLHNSRTKRYDMNVLTAWESCVNGTGVTVGVVDNGIQDHTDLNIDRNLNAGYTNKSKLANPSR
ncbi:protease 2 small chain-like [Mytilus galloprovincialis]|uniref:protease 2 small chain-like n=1 Tax=Mytilus galloprovincialis TaxID=29158 RepID=UPI003F7C86F3